MSTVTKYASNGVSFGTRYVPTTTDESDGTITFDFNAPYNIVANVQVIVTSTSVLVDMTGWAITYPAVGQVKVTDATVTISSLQTFMVVAQPAN